MEDSRFDWPAIIRASAFIVGITALYAFVVPVAGAFAVAEWDTLILSGNEIYRWLFWIIAWGITVWQGSWMLNEVHDRIIDDMLVTSVVAAIALLIVKFIIWIVYWPMDAETLVRYGPITPIDAGGALMLVVVALIAARANRF